MKIFNAMTEKEMVKVRGGGVIFLAFLALVGLGIVGSGASTIYYANKCK